MSEQKSVEISAKAYAIVRRLKDKTAVNAVVCSVMDTQNQLTCGVIQQDGLSGPGKKDHNTLAVVTGLLRRSVHSPNSRVVGGVVVSGIGSNVKYAGPHEFGVNKVVKVREHTMRNSIRDRFDHGGTAVDRFTALRLGVLSKKQASEDVQNSGKYTFSKKGAKQVLRAGNVTVKAHSMHMNLPGRHIFSRAIAARLPIYGREISAAIVREWGGKN